MAEASTKTAVSTSQSLSGGNIVASSQSWIPWIVAGVVVIVMGLLLLRKR